MLSLATRKVTSKRTAHAKMKHIVAWQRLCVTPYQSPVLPGVAPLTIARAHCTLHTHTQSKRANPCRMVLTSSSGTIVVGRNGAHTRNGRKKKANTTEHRTITVIIIRAHRLGRMVPRMNEQQQQQQRQRRHICHSNENNITAKNGKQLFMPKSFVIFLRCARVRQNGMVVHRATQFSVNVFCV